MVKYLRTKQFVRIKENFGIYKIRHRQITLYIDDVLYIDNPHFENYLGQMYPPELEIKDTTESNTSASYLDLLLSIGRDGQLHTSLYDKRDDFNFYITSFSFLSSKIPSSPAYSVFISQLIRYARASFFLFLRRCDFSISRDM